MMATKTCSNAIKACLSTLRGFFFPGKTSVASEVNFFVIAACFSKNYHSLCFCCICQLFLEPAGENELKSKLATGFHSFNRLVTGRFSVYLAKLRTGLLSFHIISSFLLSEPRDGEDWANRFGANGLVSFQILAVSEESCNTQCKYMHLHFYTHTYVCFKM